MKPILLQAEIEPPRPCDYLAGARAQLEYRVMLGVSPEEFEAMMERGWRRFGPAYFRPACQGCQKCISLRIPVAQFRPNRSQRRAQKAHANLEVVVRVPRVDPERLALYQRWHAQRERSRGWHASPLGEREYLSQFAFPHPCAREVAYYAQRDGRRELVGLCLADQTPNAWSAAYFFYDPSFDGIGTFNVLALVELAKQSGAEFLYLGYWVAECASLQYKARFGPHQLLTDRPAPEEKAEWRAPETTEREQP